MSRHLYLASQSPRRLELLRQIGLNPQVLPLRAHAERAEVDETPLAREPGAEYVQRLARLKVEAGLRAQQGRRLPPWPIIAADTSVLLGRQILGKPADAAAAARMLASYGGRGHTVLTAVAAAWQGQVRVALHASRVRFRPLAEAEIAAYVATGEPFDKAGGYAIQGRAAMFVQHLAGSHSGVMGLPLYETAELLRELGWPVLRATL